MNDFLKSILPLCAVEGDHTALWSAVYKAHRASGYSNASLSKVLVNLIGQSSGSFAHSVTAGMMALGKKHGPIAQARDDILYTTPASVAVLVKDGIKIAGFGNTFFKDQIDPSWSEVVTILRTSYPETWAKVQALQDALHAAGKTLYPNPGGLSAAACIATELERGLEEAIFVMPRMQVWLDEYIKTLGA
jgi:hypothetical protein